MSTINRTTKKCPRCNTKCLISQSKCDECGLVFTRLQFASNKEAKRAILRGEREKVIKTKDYPDDLPRWKHLLFCIFTGPFGGHDFYSGRFIRAFIRLVIFIVGIILISVGQIDFFEHFYFLPFGIISIMWFYDLAAIIFKFSYVPIALKMPQKEDFKVIK